MPLSREFAWIVPDTSDETIYGQTSVRAGQNNGESEMVKTEKEKRKVTMKGYSISLIFLIL